MGVAVRPLEQWRRGEGAAARVLLIAVLAALMLVTGARGQAPCRVLDAELSGSYQGGCKDGLAEGFGEAKGSAEYRGEFRAGRKHGKGLKIWPSGDRYEGEFVEDGKEGRGTYSWGPRTSSAGEKYSGAYRNDLRHGAGVYEWPSGDRYAGPWENDEPVGPLTPMMMARMRAQSAALEAIGRPGVKVCRFVSFGIGNRERIHGEVTAVEAGRVAVRIDDAGKQQNVLDGVPIENGLTVWSAAMDWAPCL